MSVTAPRTRSVDPDERAGDLRADGGQPERAAGAPDGAGRRRGRVERRRVAT